jgi:glutamine cyclotransferase
LAELFVAGGTRRGDQDHEMLGKGIISLVLLLYLAILAATAAGDDSATSVGSYSYEIIAAYPHDSEAYTQGLDYDDGELYESTGLYGRSAVRIEELKTGKIIEQINLPSYLFGEGLAVWGDQLIQLTWQSGRGLVWDKESLNLSGSFAYPGEGWGLTSDGERLIMSDGTDRLYFLDPQSLQRTGQIKVRCSGKPVTGLNELEYVEGEIYANIYPTSRVAVISLQGDVVAWIDFSGLVEEVARMGMIESLDSVLNGIAYDSAGRRLFVTGKLWPELFEIRILRDAGKVGS